MSLSRRHARVAAAALVLVLGLAGCGSGGEGEAGDIDPAAGDGGNQAKSSDTEILEFYDCLRDHGLEVEDPDPGSGNRITLPRITNPEDEAAVEECRPLLPNGGEPPEQDAESLAALREFTACMRDNGIDMADPEADGTLTMPAGVDPESAEFEDAQNQCREHLQGQRVMIRGGGGPQ